MTEEVANKINLFELNPSINYSCFSLDTIVEKCAMRVEMLFAAN